MKDETIETQREIIEFLEERDMTVTEYNSKEYVRGDPTVGDCTVTGAEIEVKVYLSLDDLDDDEESRFRVK